MTMFRPIIIAAALLLSGAMTQAASAKKDSVSYLDVIKFEAGTLAKDGREVTLSMNIVLDSARIRSQHTLSLTPWIVSADGQTEQAFGTVVVDGRTRHLAYERKDRLDAPDSARDAALAIIRRRNGRAQEYAYVSVLPYSSWMLDGRVELRESVSGCVQCAEGDSTAVLMGHVLPKFVPEWRTSAPAPVHEPVKLRAETRIARLDFVQNGYRIDPGMGRNRAMLDTVVSSIGLVEGRDYISIDSIFVAGHASPEGTYEYNMNLSSRRAEALAAYISDHTAVDPSKVTVEWSGEDWDGLRELLAASGMSWSGDVTEIIDTYTRDRNECERVMRAALTPAEYGWMLSTIYPSLRYCTYRVEYKVRAFTPEEAREVILERPQDLNLAEILGVAASCEPGSEEWNYAVETALRFYPAAPAAVAAVALEALENGDFRTATDVLDDVATASTPELLNILGVACACDGQYDRAGVYLSSAAEAGNPEAEHNLAQLMAVTDQL